MGCLFISISTRLEDEEGESVPEESCCYDDAVYGGCDDGCWIADVAG